MCVAGFQYCFGSLFPQDPPMPPFGKRNVYFAIVYRKYVMMVLFTC